MKHYIFLFLLLFSSIQSNAQYWTRISSDNYQDLIQLPSKDYACLTETGFVITDFQGKKVSYTSTILKAGHKYSSIKLDYDGNYWLHTNGEVHCYQVKSRTWTNGLSNVRTLEADDKGIIWLHTYQNEIKFLVKSTPFKIKFSKISISPMQSFGKGENEILASHLGDTLFVLNTSGIANKISLINSKGEFANDPKARNGVGGQILSEKAGEYTFFPIHKGHGIWSYHYNLKTNKWSQTLWLEGSGNYFGNYHLEKGQHILQTPVGNNRQIPDGYLIKEKSSISDNDCYSGYGSMRITKMTFANKDIFILTEKGVYEAQISSIPRNNSTFLESDELFADVSPNGRCFNTLSSSNGPNWSNYRSFSDTKPEFQHRSSTIFSSSLWIGAKNRATGYLHVAGDRFELSDDYSSFYQGPISTSYDLPRPWIHYVSKKEIDLHRKNYKKANYSMVSNIAKWPAHGLKNTGQAPCLAPFIDVDGNGIYTPMGGDYPDIRGDKAIYSIFNDHKIRRDSTSGNLDVEVHAMYYMFSEHPDVKVRRTVFVHYEIINRGISNYDSLKIGIWTDFDIGCPNDDYIGCNVDVNTYFGYNGDLFDETCQSTGGFESTPPISAVTFLSDSMKGFVYHNNSRTVRGDPQNGIEKFLYMNARWRDSTQMVHSGTGHKGSGGTIKTSYMFPGKRKGLPNWTEVAAGNTPGDRRGMGYIGPFTLDHGKIKTFDMMYHLVWDSIGGGDVDSIPFDVNLIKTFHSKQGYKDFTRHCTGFPNPTESLDDEQEASNDLVLYPNPTSNLLRIKFDGERIFKMTLYSLDGKMIKQEILGFNHDEETLDVSNLDKGIYLMSFQSRENEIFKKVVIQ